MVGEERVAACSQVASVHSVATRLGFEKVVQADACWGFGRHD